MTENEAKEFLGNFSLDRIEYVKGRDVDTERFNYFTEVLMTAMKALTEIQQYRAIGTVEECQQARERQIAKKSIEHKNKTDALVDKLRKYAAEYNLPPFGREIEGTAELLLEAAETIEILIIEFEEHMRYREIGTVEECQEAMERQRSKDIIHNPDGGVDEDWLCPSCGKFCSPYSKHCQYCGQVVKVGDNP